MLLNRHRITKLIELADLERRVAGSERMLREEDVAVLVKAAYDDATDLARAEFMARVKPMPTSAWPWSAVQAKTPGTSSDQQFGRMPSRLSAPGLGMRPTQPVAAAAIAKLCAGQGRIGIERASRAR